jgi:hypothetical protein
MATVTTAMRPKTRRVRVYTRLSLPLRKRLAEYCAAKGISERNVIETALEQLLESKSDTATVLARLDRLDLALDRERGQRERVHRDLEILSEAFGRFLRIWLLAHEPAVAEVVKAPAAARAAAEARYQAFAKAIAEHFVRGHRFVHDLPQVAGDGGPPQQRSSSDR